MHIRGDLPLSIMVPHARTTHYNHSAPVNITTSPLAVMVCDSTTEI